MFQETRFQPEPRSLTLGLCLHHVPPLSLRKWGALKVSEQGSDTIYYTCALGHGSGSMLGTRKWGSKTGHCKTSPVPFFLCLPFSLPVALFFLLLALSSPPLPPFLSPLRLPLRLASCQQMTSPFMFGAEHGFECSFDSVKIIAGSLSDAD